MTNIKNLNKIHLLSCYSLLFFCWADLFVRLQTGFFYTNVSTISVCSFWFTIHSIYLKTLSSWQAYSLTNVTKYDYKTDVGYTIFRLLFLLLLRNLSTSPCNEVISPSVSYLYHVRIVYICGGEIHLVAHMQSLM